MRNVTRTRRRRQSAFRECAHFIRVEVIDAGWPCRRRQPPNKKIDLFVVVSHCVKIIRLLPLLERAQSINLASHLQVTELCTGESDFATNIGSTSVCRWAATSDNERAASIFVQPCSFIRIDS